MYKDYFNLEREPFSVTPDPDFFFYAEQYKEAMAHLLYGVQERRGLLLLTGRVGSGKTTLCRALLRELDEENRTTFLQGSFDTPRELLYALARNLDVNTPDNASGEELYNRLKEFLREEYEQGRNACLIVDESQNLSVEVLEQIRLLSNLETEKKKLIQIVLVGQPELETLLNKPELRQLKQRISIRTYLSHLDKEETREYVEHRLERAARGSPAVTVEPEVYRLLSEATQGNPRIINRLADRMFLAAYVADSTTVNKEHLETALDDLSSESNKDDNRDELILRKTKAWFERSGSYLDRIVGAATDRFGIVSLTALLTVLVGTALFGGWGGTESNPTIVTPDSFDTPPVTSQDTEVPYTNKRPSKLTGLDSSTMISKGKIQADPAPKKGQPSQKIQDRSINFDQRKADTYGPSQLDPSRSTSTTPVKLSGDTNSTKPDIPNAFKLKPVEVTRVNKDTVTLSFKRSFNRYLSFLSSYKGYNGDFTSGLSRKDKLTQSIKNRLPSDSPALQLVKVKASLSSIRDLPYPVFWLTQEEPKRYLLSLPESDQIWDPFAGWVPPDERGLGSDQDGTARVLAPAPFDLTELRKLGDTGVAVVRLQELLNKTGHYDIPLVGNYGPQTRQSIRDFQRRNDLLPDGVGGPRTYLALLKENDVKLRWTEKQFKRFLD